MQKKIGIAVSLILMLVVTIGAATAMIRTRTDIGKFIINDHQREASDQYLKEQQEKTEKSSEGEKIADAFLRGRNIYHYLNGEYSSSVAFQGKHILISMGCLDLADDNAKIEGIPDGLERAIDAELRREALYLAAQDRGILPDTEAVNAELNQILFDLKTKLLAGDEETQFFFNGLRLSPEEYVKYLREVRLKDSATQKYLAEEKKEFLTKHHFDRWDEEATKAWEAYDEKIVIQWLKKDKVKFRG